MLYSYILLYIPRFNQNVYSVFISHRPKSSRQQTHFVNSQQKSNLTDLVTTREEHLNTYKEKRLKEYLTVSKVDKVCVFKILTTCRSKQVPIRTTIMSALALILCLSVGQAHILEKPNQRSQDTQVTASLASQALPRSR